MAFSRRPEVWQREERAWRPVATWVLLGAIAADFVAQLAVQSYVSANQHSAAAFVTWQGITQDWGRFLFVIGTDWAARPWTLVTSTLSHGSVTHILFNGLTLFFFGPSVERLLGRARFVGLFLVAGALSGMIQVHMSAWMATGSLFYARTGALGASGAIMMCMGVLMVLTPKATMLLMFLPIPVPLWLAGIVYAVVDILGAFNPGSGIGNFAHLSGMALGLAVGWWWKGDLRKRGLRIVDAD